MTKNIMIVGVGGQGTLLTSRILGGITLEAGYDVKLSEVHGMAQRGGSVVTFVCYGEKVAEPIVEQGQADVLIAFEKLEALRYAHFFEKGRRVNYQRSADRSDYGCNGRCRISGKHYRKPGKRAYGISDRRDERSEKNRKCESI